MKSRIKNKLIKSSIIIVDTKTIPQTFHLYEWYEMYKQLGIIMWDSSLGYKPEIYPKRNTRVFTFKDSNNNFKKTIGGKKC
jgi:hypothetical protein